MYYICKLSQRRIHFPRTVNHLHSAEDLIESDGCNSTEENYVEYIEHVQVRVQFSANQHKDVLLSIISPANTESHLLSARPYDTGSGQQSWVFTTVHFWGETAIGKWKIRMSIPVNNNQGIDVFQIRNKKIYISCFNKSINEICLIIFRSDIFPNSFKLEKM